jgi:hypothetical protein
MVSMTWPAHNIHIRQVCRWLSYRASRSRIRCSILPAPKSDPTLQLTMNALSHGAQPSVVELEEAAAHVGTEECRLRHKSS